MIQYDYQAWAAYPEHRWVFNKLDLSLRLGYAAGPAGVPIEKAGRYVVRPIYNLFGMGINAKIVDLTMDDAPDMIEHGHVPPGHFWCQYLIGTHYTLDFERVGGKWELISCMTGELESESDLTKFRVWTQCEPVLPDGFVMPDFLAGIENVKNLNVECKQNHIFEVHLRRGNTVFDEYAPGTMFRPVWNKENEDKTPEIVNLDGDQPHENANGYMRHVRRGYIIS